MRDSDGKMDHNRTEKEEKRHRFKFSWGWFRHRKKGNKIDRRAQIEKDMKSNWAELPATLRRKQKVSQQVLDEYMGEPDPDQRIEDLYSEVKKVSNSKNQTSEKTDSGHEGSGSENGSNSKVVSLEKLNDLEIETSSDVERVEGDKGAESSIVNPIVQAPDESNKMEENTESSEQSSSKSSENGVPEEVTIKIGKVEEVVVEVVQEIETKTTEQRLKLDLPSNESNDNDGDLWLEREQQRVMQLLHHAVSEDSLLLGSSSAEDSSSDDEMIDDSGTDINNPSSSSSCTNETFMSSQNTGQPGEASERDNIVETLMAIQTPQDKEDRREDLVETFLQTQEPTDPGERLVDETPHADTPIVPTHQPSSAANAFAECDLFSPGGSKTDSLLTSSEDASSQEDAEAKPGDDDVFDVPVSIPRVGLRAPSSLAAEEESTMAFYDAAVEAGQSRTQGVEEEEQQISLELIEEEDFSQMVDRMHFSTGAKWKKALLMQTLGRKPRGMATIVEEEEAAAPEQMTVREILRRFEELGCKMLPEDEKSATLKEIHDTLRCLEEKVRSYETRLRDKEREDAMTPLQSKNAPRITNEPYHTGHQNSAKPSAIESWNGRGPHHMVSSHNAVSHSHPLPPPAQPPLSHHGEETHESMGQHDGKHSLLQFAIHHFRASPEKFEMLKTADGSISGSLKVIESHKNTKKKDKSKKDKDKDKDKDKGSNKENDWTWKEQVDLVKFTSSPVEQSLLRLDAPELSELAVECFTSVMRYMGDLPMTTDLSEVKCVYTILMHCHKHESLRDEVYCQLMKQTTNNKSIKPDSCQRGWRLFSIVAAYFTCSDTLKPYLFKYLETAAYDKRRAYHGTATVCLQNLRKTFRHGGRKNVPSVEELTAISAGRNSKRQIYRLPGGSERVVNTKSTTVVQDVIEEMCAVINVQNPAEMEEFSLYCIVEGDTFTMPLARDEYILDVTTELHKNQQVFYLIFCRSVWHFPLRLDSQLYIEVVFNQIAPDYLEGLLLVMPGEQLDQDIIYDIAKMAALLHRAADMTHLPTMKEVKFLLPKPALAVRDVKPGQWVNMVQGNWRDVEPLQTIQAKAQVLEILSKWPLFGSSFFAVKRLSDPKDRADHILALNRHGVHFIDLITHETLIHYPFSEVISTRKVKSEDGILYLDMKCGNLMQQRITRLQTDQAHEISRLIRQYITMEQKLRS